MGITYIFVKSIKFSFRGKIHNPLNLSISARTLKMTGFGMKVSFKSPFSLNLSLESKNLRLGGDFR